MNKEAGRILQDNISAIKLWRVWLYLGFQDIKNRYKKTKVGVYWVFINIVLIIAGIGYIYGRLFNQDIALFLPHLAAGFVIWTFLTSAIVEGGNSLLQAEGYVKQFNMPKQVYMLRSLVSFVTIFVLGMIAVVCVLIYFDINIRLETLYVLPGIALLIFINYMHVVLSSYVSIPWRDLPHLLSSIFAILFYVTPIIFTADMLSERGLDFVYRINPFYYLIELVRYPLLNASEAPFDIYIFTISYAVILFITTAIVVYKSDKRIEYVL